VNYRKILGGPAEPFVRSSWLFGFSGIVERARHGANCARRFYLPTRIRLHSIQKARLAGLSAVISHARIAHGAKIRNNQIVNVPETSGYSSFHKGNSFRAMLAYFFSPFGTCQGFTFTLRFQPRRNRHRLRANRSTHRVISDTQRDMQRNKAADFIEDKFARAR